ncbi:MAG TPA: protein-glutamate O-methyltransferase CheR [bacterium]|nr:protein-glutamate O-methyltransferase CheR [bacterium]
MKTDVQEDPFFRRILELLLRSKGFDGNHYKPNYIKRRIAVRMRAMEKGSFSEYYHLLQRDPKEMGRLLERLTIHVTEFFRDPEVFRSLRQTVLPLFAGNVNKNIRVWCAGCSTGEEPYSLAILLQEWAPPLGMGFGILGTDIDPVSVRTAERAEYPVESVAKLPRDQVARWFVKEGGHLRIARELRQKVQFRTHDLLGPWGPSMNEFQMIFCRNMLIYLTAVQQQGIYEGFHKALAPGGYLVLGLTETLLGPSRRFFKCVDIRHRIYRAVENEGTVTGSEGKNG